MSYSDESVGNYSFFTFSGSINLRPIATYLLTSLGVVAFGHMVLGLSAQQVSTLQKICFFSPNCWKSMPYKSKRLSQNLPSPEWFVSITRLSLD